MDPATIHLKQALDDAATPTALRRWHYCCRFLACSSLFLSFRLYKHHFRILGRPRAEHDHAMALGQHRLPSRLAALLLRSSSSFFPLLSHSITTIMTITTTGQKITTPEVPQPSTDWTKSTKHALVLDLAWCWVVRTKRWTCTLHISTGQHTLTDQEIQSFFPFCYRRHGVLGKRCQLVA
jgi:hypothetical protein